jgi:hypothetical protein
LNRRCRRFNENASQRYQATLAADDIALEPREMFLEPRISDKLESQKLLELRALGRTAAETDDEFSVTEWQRPRQ